MCKQGRRTHEALHDLPPPSTCPLPAGGATHRYSQVFWPNIWSNMHKNHGMVPGPGFYPGKKEPFGAEMRTFPSSSSPRHSGGCRRHVRAPAPRAQLPPGPRRSGPPSRPHPGPTAIGAAIALYSRARAALAPPHPQPQGAPGNGADLNNSAAPADAIIIFGESNN